MKKGLTLTLMTVAVAMLGAQVMAMAPTISEIPSPIIANTGTVTGSNVFLFQDAINLENYVTTDTVATTKAAIQWSYEITGTPLYEINGVAANPTNPAVPGVNQINVATAPDLGPKGTASMGNVITVRNVHFDPIGGGGVTVEAGTGIFTDQTQMVTFVASDGTTYATREVLFYTAGGGGNRLSPGGFSNPTPVVTPVSFISNSNGWGNSIANSVGVAGSANNLAGSVTANGLCFTTAYEGYTTYGGTAVNADGLSNVGTYTSATSPFTLVANAVYRVRVTMTGSLSTAGAASVSETVPFWDFQLTNQTGYGCYGADWYISDAYGGANAVLTSGKTFDFWWAPPAISTPQWNASATGAFRTSSTDSGLGTTNQTAEMSPTLVFRMLQDDSAGAWERGGSVCLTGMQVDRWDISQMTTVSTDWSIASGAFAEANGTSSGNVNTSLGRVGTWTIAYTGGNLVITPTGNTASEASGQGLGLEYVWAQAGSNGAAAYPGAGATSAAPYATLSNVYPVPWKPNTLYQITANIAASSSADAPNPPDAFLFGMDDFSNEVDMFSMSANVGGDYLGTTAAAPGAPAPAAPTTTPSTYMAFFWSQTPSLGIDPISGTTIPYMQSLQPILYVLDTNAAAGRSGNKTGSITVSGMAVNEVSFP